MNNYSVKFEIADLLLINDYDHELLISYFQLRAVVEQALGSTIDKYRGKDEAITTSWDNMQNEVNIEMLINGWIVSY